MSATKIPWGQVLLVGAVVLAFLWAATEWTAWQLGFQAQLEPAWFEVFGWPFYRPPAFFWWTTDWSLDWLRSRVWVISGGASPSPTWPVKFNKRTLTPRTARPDRVASIGYALRNIWSKLT